MGIRLGLFAALLPAAIACSAPLWAASTAESCAAGDMLDAVRGDKLCLAVETIKGASAADKGATLVVLLHGDVSSGKAADYHYEIGRAVVAADPSAIAVAILRPGYFDSQGKRSDGSDNGRRDHYTATNIDSVAAVIKTLRERYSPSRTLLVGHSGGSAFTGVILGRHPGLVDGAVLASCPCDIVAWRDARGSRWNYSLSPSSFADRVPATARVIAITGARDTNTDSRFGRNYVQSLTRRGVAAEFQEVPEAGHDMTSSLRAAVVEAVKRLQAAFVATR